MCTRLATKKYGFCFVFAQNSFFVPKNIYEIHISSSCHKHYAISTQIEISLNYYVPIKNKEYDFTTSNMRHLFVVGEFVVASHLKIFPLQLLGPAEKPMAGPSSSKGKILTDQFFEGSGIGE